MKQSKTPINSSLEGVIVGETSISDVDGQAGQLIYRGQQLQDVIDKPMLDVAALLIWGPSLKASERESFEHYMSEQAMLNNSEIQLLYSLPKSLHPMRVLLSSIPALQMAKDGDFRQYCESEALYQGLSIAAKIPSILATWRCITTNRPSPSAIEGLNPIETFLMQFHGRAASDSAIATLNTTQILQLEHSYNASTFAARVCASTNAPIAAVLCSAIATLYGPLHGGADQAALEMAQNIGNPEKAAAYVEKCLNNNEKIMGMGHREYKALDPRAAILKPMAAALCQEDEAKNIYLTLAAVEKSCQQHFAIKGQAIWANVEFYKGAVFHALGVPSQYFTALFAMARVFGYLAHTVEFQKEPRLIRPRARYVG